LLLGLLLPTLPVPKQAEEAEEDFDSSARISLGVEGRCERDDGEQYYETPIIPAK
jgi:hypothetical protein